MHKTGKPSITVLICTRNRAQALGRMLDSATRMLVPDGLVWEILVVDNGSRDETPTVIAAFDERLPIRRVDEPRPGLSNARNAGVRAASGQHICWTDDDVLVDQNWLAAYVDAFARYPEVAVIAGRVEPVFDEPPPSWFLDNEELLGGLVAKRDFGDAEAILPSDAQHLPFGANYAVRTSEQRRYAYDPNLGVSPTHKRLGEETALLSAILATGPRALWLPTARVNHLISKDRMTLGAISAYCRAAGETWAYLSDHGGLPIMGENAPPGGHRIGGAPVWVLRLMLQYGLIYLRHRRAQPREWMEAFCLFNRYRGATEYWFRAARSALQ